MARWFAHEIQYRSASCGWAIIFALSLLLIEAAPVLSQGQPSAPQAQPLQGGFAPPNQQPNQAPAQPNQGQSEPPAQGAPQPEAAKKPGNMFDAIGRWWDKSAADLKRSIDDNNAKWKQSVDENNAKWKQSVDESNAKWRQGVEENNAKWRELNAANEKAAKEAAAASREAAEALRNLSNIRIVEGRQVCETAANGSPDCQTAAEVFCKSKGFATGKSADITTTRKCSMRSIIQRDERECKVETVMIKAACQ